MRGSFGFGRNGGGGGGGGDMMRTVGRVMRTRINQIQDPFSSSSHTSSSHTKRSTTPPKSRKNSSTSKHGLAISSQKNNNNINNVPVYAASTNGEVDEFEIDGDWECLEDYYDPVFGVVPDSLEVQRAMFSLGQFLHPSPKSQSATDEVLCDVDKDISGQNWNATDVLQRTSLRGSSQDWIEPSMQLYDLRLACSSGWEKVYDAFHLLQTEPSVQKMVVSLSSDKGVWDAVLNNEAVREIMESYLNAETSPLNTDKTSNNENSNVLIWIMDHMKGKLMEVVGNITQFIGGIFKPPNPDKSEESIDFSEKIKSSFLLTIVVLLIVVVTRGSKA